MTFLREALLALLVAVVGVPSAQAKFAYQPQPEGLAEAIGSPAVATLSRTHTALVWRDADPYNAGSKNEYFFADFSTDSLTRKDGYSCGGYPASTAKFLAAMGAVECGAFGEFADDQPVITFHG